MKGYPKRLSTKADYEYVRDHFPEKKWKRDWQALIDDETKWIADHAPMDSKSVVTESDTKKIIAAEDTGERTLVEYKSDPQARLYRLGFTKQDVQKSLDNALSAEVIKR